MGDMSRVTDTKLSRDVATQVLPSVRSGILGMTLILSLTALGLAQGPWRYIGPEDRTASVSDLAMVPADPMTLYAGTSGDGVFQSTDRGASWSRINQGLPIRSNIRALAINPTDPMTLYAGGLDGMFQSTDRGANWGVINNGLTTLNVRALAMDPTDPMTLFAGTDGSGVFQTTDGGAHWSAVNNGLDKPNIRSLMIDPTDPMRVYAGTVSGVFQTTDEGRP